MALGHSARDALRMLHGHGVVMEAKPFSIGFRIEHPQSVIDHAPLGPPRGPPAAGRGRLQAGAPRANGRAVYSFCMCPGGTVVAATSEPERVVTNGMSQYSRNERNANAGIVVGIDPHDYPHDPAASRPTWARPTGGGLACRAVPPAVGQRAAAPAGVQRLRAGRAPTTARRASWWATSLRASPPPSWAAWSPRTSPAWPWATCTRPCLATPSRPCAKPCPAFGRKIEGFTTCPMRC